MPRSDGLMRLAARAFRLSSIVACITVIAIVGTGCRKAASDSGLLPGTHMLVLPDGKQLTSSDPTAVQYRDISVRLEVVGIDIQGDPVAQATGNHREVKSTESVAVGSRLNAWLAQVERSGPAASGSSATSREYWLIAAGPDPTRNDMRLAYCVVATVTGNEASAKDELLQCIEGWTLPGKK